MSILLTRVVRNGDFWVYVGCAAVALMLWYVVIPASVTARYSGMGGSPQLFPKIAVASIFLLSLLKIVVLPFEALREAPLKQDGDDDVTAADTLRSIVGVGLTLIFAFVLTPWIGFYSASFAFLVAMFLYFGERRLHIVALTAVIMPLAIYLLLEVMLNLILPRGSLL